MQQQKGIRFFVHQLLRKQTFHNSKMTTIQYRSVLVWSLSIHFRLAGFLGSQIHLARLQVMHIWENHS